MFKKYKKEITDNILLVDLDYFKDDEKHETTMTFCNGYAYGDYGSDFIILSYPLIETLSEEQEDYISEYMGRQMIKETGINYKDIATTYGQIVK